MSPQWIADDMARERKTSLRHQTRWTTAQWRKAELALFAAYWFLVGALTAWIAARWAQ